MGGCQCMKNGNTNDKNEITSNQVSKSRQKETNIYDMSQDHSIIAMNLSSSVILKQGKKIIKKR